MHSGSENWLSSTTAAGRRCQRSSSLWDSFTRVFWYTPQSCNQESLRYHRLVPETLFKASVQSSFLLAVRWWFVFVFVFLILVFREAIFSISHIILWFRDLLKKSLLSRKVKKRSEERTYFAQIARSSAIHHFYTWKSLWKVSQCFFGINNCCAGLSFLHCLVSFAVWWGSCSVCSFFSRGMSALQVQWHCIFYGSMRCWQ